MKSMNEGVDAHLEELLERFAEATAAGRKDDADRIWREYESLQHRRHEPRRLRPEADRDPGSGSQARSPFDA
jgi:hypothetical protein